ncbi:hypothetical protein VL15_15185 [Burkholderia cepacia]|uniref:Uncharacterized protein n=1 Tax=Burkholderia cepacia TaxID=292 RepID=A0A0J5WQS8_BURCE|nr:hypothetical protein [Burkholderia cepacia]KML57059.1 hypothetical protein VL15_15185 [Burkholderia cepacia]
MNYNTEELMIDGIKDDYFAMTNRDGFSPQIVVYTNEGDRLFSLPGDWNAEQINIAIGVFERGERSGEKRGIAMAQRTMRDALGIIH